MDKNKVVNFNNSNNKKEKITIDNDQTVLFHNGEKIEFDGLLLAGDSKGERIVITGGLSLEQTILLEKEISYIVLKMMDDR